MRPDARQMQPCRMIRAHGVVHLATEAARHHAKHMHEKTRETSGLRLRLASAKVERAGARLPVW